MCACHKITDITKSLSLALCGNIRVCLGSCLGCQGGNKPQLPAKLHGGISAETESSVTRRGKRRTSATGDLCQNRSLGAAARVVTGSTEREAGMSAWGRSFAGTKRSSRGRLPYPAPPAATELVFLLSAHAEKVELHPEASVVI